MHWRGRSPCWRNYPRLKCEGVMAYEAHIGHIPKLLGGPAKARAKAVSLFRQYVACLAADQRTILNLGGSSTALLYDRWVGANELSIGSAFMLPTDFDVPSLNQLQPAAFIATPILKVVEPRCRASTSAPGCCRSSACCRGAAVFSMAANGWPSPSIPPGMKPDKTFGFSTNQQFMALPDDVSGRARRLRVPAPDAERVRAAAVRIDHGLFRWRHRRPLAGAAVLLRGNPDHA